MSEEKDVVVRERDQLVEDASKAAEEQRIRMVEVETVRVAAEKAAQEEFIAKFVPAFKNRLEDLKADH